MSGVKPYVQDSQSGLSAVNERAPDLAPVTPAGPDGFAPAPSWSQMFTAARPAALQATPGYDNAKSIQGWAPIVDALGLPPSENPGLFGDLDAAGVARFGNAGNMVSKLATQAKQGDTLFGNVYMADRPLQESLVLAAIRARRATDPNFLPGVPDAPEKIHNYLEQQQAQKRAAGAAVLARGSTVGRTTASLAAGATESAINDPTFIPSMLFGGGTAETVLQAVGRDALINGVLTAGQQPMLAHNMAESGEHLTVAQAAGNIAEGTAIGAVLGGTIHLGAEHIPPALFQVMPETVQRRWAGQMKVGENGPLLTDLLHDMDNRELSAFARTTIGPHMTPDERSAANVLDRTQELGEASPFMPGPAGDAAHGANIAEGLKSILDGTPRVPPSTGDLLATTSLNPTATPNVAPLSLGRTAVPPDIVQFFKGKGLDDAHAYGIAAGIMAESRGDHTAINPKSGALGLGQWLGQRKAGLLDRYGTNPTRGEQLEFLWHELNGGDPGGAHVLEAKDAGSVLDAYVRKFMRPAAGFETDRDLSAGMSALGHKDELPETSAGVAASAGGDDDLVAALQRDAEQADAEGLAAQEGAEAPDAPLGNSPELTAADLPILKRDLFASDADWAEAQVELHQQLRDQMAPRSPGDGPPARAEGWAAPEVGSATGGAEAASEQLSATDQRDRLAVILRRIDGDQTRYAASADYQQHVAPRNDILFDVGADAERPELLARQVRRREIIQHALGDERYSDVRRAALLPAEGRLDALSAISDQEVQKVAAHERAIHEHQNNSVLLDQARSGAANDATLRHLASLDLWPETRIDAPELKAFDQGGNGRAALTDSLEHDFRMAAKDPALAKRSYLIDESGKPRTLLDILDELDVDRDAAAALRACAGGAT